MEYSIQKPLDLTELEELLITPEGFPDLPAEEYKKFSQGQLTQFCVKNALYQVATSELLDVLDKLIGDRKTIEIGAGAGWLGSHLDIKMTDNKQQERPEIKMLYKAMQQPVIKYHKDIIKREGNEAVRLFKPEVVVASWITAQKDYQGNPLNATGVVEEPIVEAVDYYIIVGNENTHDNKAILHKYDHFRIKADWLLSRSMSKEKNVIYIVAKDLDKIPLYKIVPTNIHITKIEHK